MELRARIDLICGAIGLMVSRFVVIGLDYEYNIINAVIAGAIFGAIFVGLGELVYKITIALTNKGWFYYLPATGGFIIYSFLLYIVYLVLILAIFQEKHVTIAHIGAISLGILTGFAIIRKQMIKYKNKIREESK